MQLYLIRHAQSTNNALPRDQRVEDAPLTELGHQQCAHLAEWIPRLALSQIFCSPFLRTLQTASYLSRAVGLVPKIRVDLHEQGGCVSGWSQESFEGKPGMTGEEIRHKFPEYCLGAGVDERGWWSSKPFETDEAAQHRAARLVEQTIEEFSGSAARIAYVMHADICRLVLSQFHVEPLAIPFNTSITSVQVTPAGCRLEDYNCVGHLPLELLTS